MTTPIPPGQTQMTRQRAVSTASRQVDGRDLTGTRYQQLAQNAEASQVREAGIRALAERLYDSGLGELLLEQQAVLVELIRDKRMAGAGTL